MVDRRQRFCRERPPQIRHLLHCRRDPGLQIHRGLREPLQRLRRIHQKITHVRKILRLLIQDIIRLPTRRNNLNQQRSFIKLARVLPIINLLLNRKRLLQRALRMLQRLRELSGSLRPKFAH